MGDFSWHTLGHLVPTEPCINTTGYLSAVAGHIHLLMTVSSKTNSMPQITQMTSCFQLFLCVFLSVEHFVTSGSPHLPPSLPSISLHVRLHYICFFFSEVLSSISTVLPLHVSKSVSRPEPSNLVHPGRSQ